MESRENMMPAVESISPEASSKYQLIPKTDNSGQIAGPPGFSPVSGGGMPSSLVKKKRGRPRKYGPDGMVAGGAAASGRTLSPVAISTSAPPSSGGYSDINFGEPQRSGGGFQAETKKKRGKISSLETRPEHVYRSMSPGDRISSGGSFTPHMVTVNPGEDVTSKIISFTKDGPRAICILSALGVISHVTLRHGSSSGGTVTYEGRFEILSLSGSFTPGDTGGIVSREGGMSITLSSPDGRVVGGLLGGLLTAAGPVQVIVASFLPDIGSPIESKPKKPKVKLLTPVTAPNPPRPAPTNVDHFNFDDPGQDHDGSTARTTGSTPAPNFDRENCTPTMPTVHDWRRSVTDMNVSWTGD